MTVTNLSDKAKEVLQVLREKAEGSASVNGWDMVYLDNASHKLKMEAKQFRAYLKVLSEAGLYKPYDGYAWGEVKVEG